MADNKSANPKISPHNRNSLITTIEHAIDISNKGTGPTIAPREQALLQDIILTAKGKDPGVYHDTTWYKKQFENDKSFDAFGNFTQTFETSYKNNNP